MTALHPACQAIADEIQVLQRELETLSADLKTAAPGGKPFIVAQIRKLTAKISARRQAFNKCMAEHPLPAPVTSTLTGTAGIWRFPVNAAGYFTPVSLRLTFSGYHYANVALQFPTMVFPNVISGIQGDVTVSASSNYSGVYHSTTHNISIPLTLTFAPPGWVSGFWSFLFPTGPSPVTLIAPGLTTLTVPWPIDPNQKAIGLPWATTPGSNLGTIRLVGIGFGSDGYFNGEGFLLEIRGKLLPVV